MNNEKYEIFYGDDIVAVVYDADSVGTFITAMLNEFDMSDMQISVIAVPKSEG